MSELKKVAEALGALKGDGRFAVEQACPSEHLQITVEGVGPIAFPISAAAARALSSIARPAPFGRRDRTLYDRNVRDTGEIEKSRIRIDARAWKKTLDPQLTMLRDRLGLAKTGKLRAVLDKMLVYGRGQFFAAHQDSEKAGDMVGTLVVELPTQHSGGATTVEHRGEKLEFSGAARGPQDLSLLAFYSDCRHEVKPVQSGYRVVLTYRLHHSEGANEEAPADLAARVDRLASTVESYFASPAAMVGSSTSPPAPQERLIYLLDHEYTQQSLGWDHLKNGDRVCAGALRQVAERLDCEVFLALADVHESWLCEEDEDYGFGSRGRYRDHGELEEEDDDEAETEDDKTDYDLIELCDSDIELRHWVGPTGEVAPAVSTSVMDDELCFTLASVDMDPWKTEHEGNMGNYGNTVDRWYHRAALVMWPRALNFVVRARVSPAWAIRQIEAALAAGEIKDARGKAESLLPFWHRSAQEEKDASFFGKLCKLLRSLDDAALAHALLSPLGPDRLTSRATPAFVGLVERFGLAWSQGLFEAWSKRSHYDSPPWLTSLPRLCEALSASGATSGRALAQWLLDRETVRFEESHAFRRTQDWEDGATVKGTLSELVALIDAARALDAVTTRDRIVAFLIGPATGLPLLQAGALLRSCRDGRKPAEVRALGLHRLHRHVVSALEAAVAAPPRRADDWSIEPPGECTCALCQELARFLRAPDRIEHAWPLAKERRRHIHDVIEDNRLPVSHETIRRGSPQTLVLKKQNALFEREKRLREEQKALLAWLRREGEAFSEGG